MYCTNANHGTDFSMRANRGEMNGGIGTSILPKSLSAKTKSNISVSLIDISAGNIILNHTKKSSEPQRMQ